MTGKETPVLRRKTDLIGKPTKEIRALIKDMEDTVISVDGLGLAAPQVGRSLRLCLCKLGGTENDGKFVALINPQITWKNDEMDIAEEGCLSLPGEWVNVPRATGIVVRYIDGKGKEQERKLSGLDARVVQHELDHLDGILIVDYAGLVQSLIPAPAGRVPSA